MIVFFLGLIDIFAALILLFPNSILLGAAFWIGAIHLIKGIASLTGAIMSGWWFEWMGLTDLLTGLALLLFWNVPYLWAPLIFKGIWSIILGR